MSRQGTALRGSFFIKYQIFTISLPAQAYRFAVHSAEDCKHTALLPDTGIDGVTCEVDADNGDI